MTCETTPKVNEKDILYSTEDTIIETQYSRLIKEIDEYQSELKEVDKRRKKKLKKKMNEEEDTYSYSSEITSRKNLIVRLQKNQFFQRVIHALTSMNPLLGLLAKLVVQLILTILSIIQVRSMIDKGMMDDMSNAYSLATNVQGGR